MERINPLIVSGTDVIAGRCDLPATPADLTPTLASRIGLLMPGADGSAHARLFQPRCTR